MFVLPLSYALTFDRVTLRAEDLARVRSARAEMLRSGGQAAGVREDVA
jgi:hypothetical protein